MQSSGPHRDTILDHVGTVNRTRPKMCWPEPRQSTFDSLGYSSKVKHHTPLSQVWTHVWACSLSFLVERSISSHSGVAETDATSSCHRVQPAPAHNLVPKQLDKKDRIKNLVPIPSVSLSDVPTSSCQNHSRLVDIRMPILRNPTGSLHSRP